MNNRLVLLVVACMPGLSIASNTANHSDPATAVIFWITLIFMFGLIGRYIAMKLKQPAVLGELLMGLLLGNVCYFLGIQLVVILREGPIIYNIVRDILAGLPLAQAIDLNMVNTVYAKGIYDALSTKNAIELIKVTYVVDMFSRYGVIFLLFMVGLDSSVAQLRRTGRQSTQVAVIGVLAPLGLGLLVMHYLLPTSPLHTNLFVAATLTATSVGITARVLKEMMKLQTPEAQTILGAAILDDVLALLLLAIVSNIVLENSINLMQISCIIMLALLFLGGALAFGPWAIKRAVKLCSFFPLWESKLIVAFILTMFLSWLASLVQLASIIGAFIAGIILNDDFFKREDELKKRLTIKHLVAPFEAVFAPLFFMLVGMQVKLEMFMDWHVLLLAFSLLAVAIVGKLASGLGGKCSDDRLLIGVGMLPRGEVGLVFASIGITLGVISQQIFSAIVLMVTMTTIISPLWLKQRYRKKEC
ncbi:MAG: cation:proton antiporter [Legionella sp.]